MVIRKFLQRWGRDHEEIERLVKAFPSSLENGVRAVADVLPFNEKNLVLADGTLQRLDLLVTEYKPDDLVVGTETIRIPYRVYLKEPNEDRVESLTELQQTILDCIYLLHHDGYVRQKHLERLRGKADLFVCPFTIRLLGEYVVGILSELDPIIDGEALAAYAEFLRANRFFWKQTQSRVVSYWYEYYRADFPILKEYVGKRIVDRLNAAVRNLNTY